MARFFIIGASGETDRWLVDTQQEQVHRMDAADIDDLGSAPVIKGVAVAIAAEERAALASHQIFGG